MERVACYIRVSTEEQKLHGISLDAQIDKLTEYAEKNHLLIVEWYKDEGISGRKLIRKRPALQRMLNDARERKFDRILFIKLDRFFRSVAEYHECMKLIDPVVWTATEEKYDLTTANGRAFVNMKLTIAELEADQTAERIRIVNDYKVKTGQALQGDREQGFAYTVVKIDGVKKVVPDKEEVPIALDLIDHYLTYKSKGSLVEYAKTKYGMTMSYKSVSLFLKNTKLYGYYRGNPNYCEGIISKEKYDQIQDTLALNIRSTRKARVYLFTGLIKCPCCGRTLSAKFQHSNLTNQDYMLYRCANAYMDKKCEFRHQINEKRIEPDLIENLDKYVEEYIVSSSVENTETENKNIEKRIEEIKQEMANSVKSFNKGRMTEKEHDEEYERLERDLNALQAQIRPSEERDLAIYQELLQSGWKGLYGALNRENKRAFWRKYVKEIQITHDGYKYKSTPLFF